MNSIKRLEALVSILFVCVFNALSQSITINAPVGGENLYVGSSYKVEWTSSDLASNYVRLEYSVDQGSSWKIIESGVTNKGSYNWLVPSTVSSQCLFRVSDFGNSELSSTSNSVFVIKEPFIELTSPLGGEVLEGCSNYTITYNVGGIDSYVQLYYSFDGGTNWVHIKDESIEDSSVLTTSWSVPSIVSDLFKVKATGFYYTQKNIQSVSGNFSVTSTTSSSLTLLSPNGGESFSPSSLQKVRWTSTGTVGEVTLRYSSDNGTSWHYLKNPGGGSSTSVLNTGSYDWVVPSVTASSNFLVEISESSKPCIRDYSDGYFSIDNNPSIVLIYPFGGETLYGGTTYTLSWSFSNLPSNAVKLDYSLDQGETWNLISNQNNSNGSYAWLVPSELNSAEVLLKVSSILNPAICAVTNKPFTIQPPAIEVTAPNGGESITGCTPYTIRWNQVGVHNYVNLYYSINDGREWHYIGQDFIGDNSNYYNWHVPSLASSSVRIKVVGDNTINVKDSSDVTFTISQGTNYISLLSPEAGDSWASSSVKSIRWSNIGEVGNVSIRYSINGGSTWEWVRNPAGMVAENIANTGAYEWLLPSNSVSSKCLIHIHDYSTGCISALSSDYFSINNTNPEITLKYPLGGEKLYAGRTYTLSWSSTSLPSGYVDLAYSMDNGLTWSDIATSVPNSDNYSWLLPLSLNSHECQIRVSALGDPTLFATSKEVFTIAPQVLELASLSSGESVTPCETYTIQYNQEGVQEYVNLYYSLNGGDWVFIDEDYAADQSNFYNWVVPSLPSGSVKIKVSSSLNKFIADSSVVAFAIISGPDNFTLTYPNGGEVLPSSSLQTISWTSSGTVCNVSIKYSLNGGADWEWVTNSKNESADNVANTGSYEWLLPKNIAASDCRIQIYDNNQGCVIDDSDSAFSITNIPFITVTNPNGGDTLYANGARFITWSSTNLPTNFVKIEYSKNNGETWQVISSSTTNSGRYNWGIPKSLGGASCIIKVSSVSNPAIYDISNSNFYVASQSLVLLEPNGGERLPGCGTYTVKWSQVGVQGVKLYYSINGGADWIYERDLTSRNASNIFDWELPSVNSENVRVKLVDYYDASIKDSSDANFTIVPGGDKITVVTPSAGDIIGNATIQTINWQTEGVVKNVSVQYTLDGSSWISMMTPANTSSYYVPNNGSLEWMVSYLSPTSRGMIRINDYDKPCVVGYSTPYFTVDNTPRITVVKPYSNVKYYAGQTTEISWMSSNLQGNYVRIQYSIDNGVSWNLIHNYTYNYGSYSWTVPDITAENVLIKVTSMRNVVDAYNVFGVSQNGFSVFKPYVTVLTPNAGTEVWKAGESKTISWSSTGLSNSSRVSLFYSLDNGKSYALIAASITNSGKYIWTIPDTISTTSKAYVKVAPLVYSQQYDTNDVAFSIVKPVVGIIVPNDGQVWYVGESKAIQWSTDGASGNVKLEYSTDGAVNWSTIAESAPNTGFYYWTIPFTTNVSTSCYIRISEVSNPDNQNTNEIPFSIAKPVLTINAPVSKEDWYVGQKNIISWTNKGLASDYVRIEYSEDRGATWKLIEDSILNVGSYVWFLPSFDNAITEVTIKLSDQQDPSVSDQTKETITIHKPELSILVPIGEETWYQGQSRVITWKSAGGVPGNIKIELMNDYGSEVLISSTPNTGMYSWNVPFTTSPGVNYKIKISSTSDPAIADTSNSTFRIEKPTLYLTAPYGGETWYHDQTKKITWVAAGLKSPTVKLEYSNDNGLSWTLINAAAPNSNEYNWKLPSTLIVSNQYLVKVTDGLFSSLFSESGKTFSVKESRKGDTFANPIAITSFPFAVIDTTTLYSDSYVGAVNQPSNDVFYKFVVPECVDSMIFATSGSHFDTYLHIIDSTQSVIESNNYANGTIYAAISTKVLIPGQTYYLIVEGNGVKSGIYNLSIKTFLNETKIKVSGNNTVFCKGDEVHLVSTKSNSYIWSTGATTEAISVLPEDTTVYWVSATNGKGCTYTDTIKINVIPVVAPDPVTAMIPEDSTLNLHLPVAISWPPALNASTYDVYIWKHNEPVPNKPYIVSTNSINDTVSSLEFGSLYNWKVVAKNSCSATEGPVQRFEVRHLPDLQVVSVKTPIAMYSGQQLTVSWEVRNDGMGNTGSVAWKDGVYLSADSVLNVTQDIFIGSVPNLTYLAEGMGYSQTAGFVVPQNLVGDYFVLVNTDYLDNVVESDEWNNTRMDTTSGILTVSIPPKPDLIVSSLGAPIATFSGTKVDVTYSVTNTAIANAIGDALYNHRRNYGYSAANSCSFDEHYWTDAIYISRDSILRKTEAKLLANVSVKLRSPKYQGSYLCDGITEWYTIPDYLQKDSSYTNVVQVTIPHSYSGQYYIYIMADEKNNVDELSNINNSERSNPIYVTLSPPANLVVSSVNVPSIGYSGKSFSVSWDVTNAGANPPIENAWVDKVYLSNLDTFNLKEVIEVGSVNKSNGAALMPDSVYRSSLVFNLPEGISGNYYVYVHTDAKGDVFEYTYDNDNIKRSSAVSVNLSPYADLSMENITVTDTVRASSETYVSWTVKNIGQAELSSNWTDKVCISSSPEWSPASSVALATFNRIAALGVGKSYTEKATVKIPQDLDEGVYYMFVYTDCKDEVYEYGNERNNIVRSDTLGTKNKVYVLPQLLADINVMDFNAPLTAGSGKKVTLSWKVSNTGDVSTIVDFWNDFVFISKDTILDDSDVRLAYKAVNGALNPGVDYFVSQEVTVPVGYSGKNYLLLSSDHNQRISNESERANNKFRSQIDISLTPPPDLAVTMINTPASLYTGQEILVSYTVKNAGEGATVENGWADRIYLASSRTSAIDNNVIGSFYRKGNLAGGESYTASLKVTLPKHLSGNYFLVVKTDDYNYVFENDKEGNNQSDVVVTIQVARPSDLVIDNFSVPTSSEPGQNIQVAYSVKNVGVNPAIGQLNDLLFFSSDSQLNEVRDPLFSSKKEYIELQAGDSIVRTFSSKVPGIVEGSYYGIGRTNAINAIAETTLENNTRVSSNQMEVTIKELLLEVPETISLDKEDLLYYKINVPANKDLLVTLTSNRLNGVNEIYGAYNRVPSLNDFDYLFENPNSVNQQLLVPSTQSGAYYILVKTPTNYNGLQNVSIVAKALPFSLFEVASDTVGQGVVTTRLSGAGFNKNTQIVLLDQYNKALDTAEIRTFKNSMQVDVRWNLTNVPVGTYAIKMINPDETFVLNKALRVEASTGFLVDFNEIAPDLVRLGGKAQYTFYIQNIGNVDVPFIDADLTMPSESVVSAFTVSKGIRKRSGYTSKSAGMDDYYKAGSYKVIPVLAKDVRPEETLAMNLTVSDIKGEFFPVRTRAVGYSGERYIAQQVNSAETSRRKILESPLASTELRNFALDSTSFMNNILAVYYSEGLFTQEEFASVAPACSGCAENLPIAQDGSFTYSPGTSPGTLYASSLTFGPGQDYLWEINRYTGMAGGNQGWDLIRVAGAIQITSSALNPFVIRVASLDLSNSPNRLTGWYPAVDTSWVIAIASGGIKGFAADKFAINTSRFTIYNELYGGSYYLKLSGTDSLMLCFRSYRPGIGESGVPGAPGGSVGQPGSPGGPGGPGNGIIPPGIGGPGGEGGFNAPGGPGGPGGAGTAAGEAGGIGGIGGVGGTGGGSGGPGGIGGQGGPDGIGGPGGAGGPGGLGDSGKDGGSGGKGGKGGSGPAGTGKDGQNGTKGPSGPADDNQDRAESRINCTTTVVVNTSFCNTFFTVTGCALAVGSCIESLFESIFATPAWGVVNCSMGAFGCGYSIGSLISDPDALPSWGPGDVGCVPGGLNLLGAATVLNCMAQKVLCSQVVTSCDPNDMIGPKGYGEGRYVSRSEVLPYTIRYENDPEAATAPAQKVEIRQVLDSDLNPLTFRVKDFGFADYIFTVDGNVSSYFNTVDLPDSLGYDLEVTAGIDIEKNEAFWVLQTIDPKTGLPPADPLKGFLALNDSSGVGEGFVNYTIKAKNNAITGDSILALAEIVFDINAPIITPEIFNIIDAEPPVSKIKVLGTDSDSISVTAMIVDDLKGSGAKAYDLYVSEGNEAFKLVASDISGDSTVKIAAREGEVYCLYAVSKDNVNNKEAQKLQADTCFISTGVVTGAVTPKVEGTFILYPNPSDGYKFNVLITGLESQETVTLEVVDVLGRSMSVTEFKDAAYHIDSEVKLSTKLDPGIYFVNCYTKKGKSVKKMIVER